MRFPQMRTLCAAALLTTAPAFAAVDGKVLNGTSGQPQPDALVSLVQPGQGAMQVLGSVKSDAQGRFHFDQNPQGPRIVQVLYHGVQYNQVAPPGTSTSALTVTVYEPTKETGVAHLAQHLTLLQPGETQLSVSENFIFQNAANLTFHDPQSGSAQVYVPEAGTASAKVSITAPGGMPISREITPSRMPGFFKIDYPLKPGETRFEVTYTLPASKPLVFESRIAQNAQPLRLVVPNGITLKGENLQSLGQEPTTQAGIYGVTGDKYRVEIEGTEAPAEPDGDDGRPQVHVSRPHVYAQIWLVLGLILGILAVGGIILFLREAPAAGKR